MRDLNRILKVVLTVLFIGTVFSSTSWDSNRQFHDSGYLIEEAESSRQGLATEFLDDGVDVLVTTYASKFSEAFSGQSIPHSWVLFIQPVGQLIAPKPTSPPAFVI